MTQRGGAPTPPPSPPRSAFAQALSALAGIVLFLVFCALGTWQVYRLQWKLDLIARVERRVHSPPQPLPAPATWPRLDVRALEYQPVRTQGQWQPAQTVLTQASTALGAGFWVVTPLQQADGRQVLVNRGFVPDGQSSAWRNAGQVAAATPAGPVTVVGLLRASEPKGGFLRSNDPARGRWFSRDVQAIAQARGVTNAAPFFIDAGLPAEGPPIADEVNLSAEKNQDWPRPGLTQIHFVNNHLVYAITWYALALMVLGAAWHIAHLQRRRRARNPLEAAPSAGA